MLSWYIALGAFVIWLCAIALYTRRYYGPWLQQRRRRKADARKASAK